MVVNILFGLIISVYSNFAMMLNCGVILATTLLLLATLMAPLKEAFKVSLATLIPMGGFIAFVCGFYSIPQFENNWIVILDIFLLLIGIVLLIVTSLISKLDM